MRLNCFDPAHETGLAQYPRHASSVRAGSSAGSFSFRQGSIFPFTWVRFTFVTAFDQLCKIRGQRPGIVGVVIVGAAVGVDKAEIVAVARIDGTAPRIGRRQREKPPCLPARFQRYTHKNDLFPLPVALQDIPQQGVLPVYQSPRLCAMRSSLSMASLGRTVFPLGAVKHLAGSGT